MYLYIMLRDSKDIEGLRKKIIDQYTIVLSTVFRRLNLCITIKPIDNPVMRIISSYCILFIGFRNSQQEFSDLIIRDFLNLKGSIILCNYSTDSIARNPEGRTFYRYK